MPGSDVSCIDIEPDLWVTVSRFSGCGATMNECWGGGRSAAWQQAGGGGGGGPYQNLADWGARTGGFVGSAALNVGAALSALAAIGDAIGGVECDEAACWGNPPLMSSRGAFTRDGFMNTGTRWDDYLRIGIGRHRGREIFRVSGKLVERFKRNGHIDLPWIGPWGR